MRGVLQAWVVVALLATSAAAQDDSDRWICIGSEEVMRPAREHWDKAVAAYNNRDFDRVIKEAIWILDKGKQAYPEVENCLACAAIDLLNRTATHHPDALKTLKQRRAAAEKAFRAGKGTPALALELYTINQKLADWTRTQEFYNELGEQGGKTAAKMQRILFRHIEESLIEDEEYEALLKGGASGPSSLEARREALDAMLATHQQGDSTLANQAKRHLCRSVGRYYQAMLATGRKEEAQELADEYLEYFPSGTTYAILIRHAVAAEQYTTARALAKAAQKKLSEEEYSQTVESEATAIPKNKKDRVVKKPDETKKKGQTKKKD